jgi:hypothetical protein
MAEQTAPFQQLDFLYTPSRDVASDLVFVTEVLGGRVVFAVEAMGTRVAAVRLTAGPPLVLLADHVEGERAPSSCTGWPTWRPPWLGLRRGAGSGSGPWRSLRGRAARFKRRAATGSRCMS